MKKILRTFIIFLLTACILSAQGAPQTVTAASATAKTKSHSSKKNTFSKTVSEDTYQKAITKGFLGKRYGTGKGRYLCNTYVQKALEKVANKHLKKTGEDSFTDLKVSAPGQDRAPTSYEWNAHQVRLTYKDCTYNKKSDTVTWNKKTTSSTIRKKNSGTKYRALELGQVLTYSSHVALYFGKYDGKDEVAARLLELGVYKKGELVRKSDRYVDKKGRTIIRDYDGAGKYWRIHATCSGLLIDNSIISRSSFGTQSFGQWKKTIPTGISVTNDEYAKERESQK